jgi:dipeptidyl aminopeptidase/acylaminoacyl peptidase
MKNWILGAVASAISLVAVVPAQSDEGKIAFISKRTGNPDLFVMSPDGSGQTNLTNSPSANEEFPAWSSDGKELGYTAVDMLWTMSADGTNKQSIPIGHFPRNIAFKPNSSILGYSRYAGYDGDDIYVIERDGSTETPFISKPWSEHYLRWSPDGSKISFISHDYHNNGHFIDIVPIVFTANADGSGQVPLTARGNKTNGGANWSPDGGQLVFADSRYGNSEIHVMNADGSGQTRLTNHIAHDTSPVFSPDGSRIAFVSNRDGNSEIYVMNANGTGVTRITNDPADDYSPDWQQSLTPNAPSVSISDAEATEGATGASSATFTVTLSRASDAPVTVTYRSYDGSAVAGTDFTEIPGTTLTFAPGDVSKTIVVPVIDDAINEANETFTVRLSAVGASVADQEGVATIIDGDALPGLSIDDVTIVEGTKNPNTNEGSATSALFTVTLSAASGRTVTVRYETVGGKAVSGSDYAQQSGTLTFNPGETSKTISISIAADAEIEPDETFGVTLTQAVNATISDNEGTGIITNDDVAPAILSFTPEIGTVGTSVTITGTNFSYPAVFFNGTRAQYSSYSATEIVTTVPLGATTGPITVTTASASTTSSDTFVVLNSSPQVSEPTASPTALARGQATTLSVTATDADGASDLRYVHLMLSPTGRSLSDPGSGLWMHFNAVERRLYAWNGSGWGTGASMGRNSTLTTPQGTITLSGNWLRYVANGYGITVTFTPAISFTGTFVLRALSQDTQPANGWDINSMRDGSIVTIGDSNVQAQVSSLVASPTSLLPGQSTLLRVDTTDINGASDLRYVHLMLLPKGSPATPWASGDELWLHYNFVEGKLYAWNGSNWGTGVTLGSSGTLATPQGTVNLGTSSIRSIASGYRISIVFTPNSSYLGTFVLRALPQDTEPVNGWDLGSMREGSIVTIGVSNVQAQVTSPTASPTSLAPGESTTLSIDATDQDGAGDLRYAHLMLSPQGSSPSDPRSGLWMHYNFTEGKLYAWNGSDWGTGATLSSPGTLTTAQGTIDVGASSVISIPNGFRISIAFSPNSSFLGAFMLRALPQDARPVNGWDLGSLRDGSIVSIGNIPTSSSTAKTPPSGGSS